MSNCIVFQCMSSTVSQNERDLLLEKVDKQIDRDYLLKVEQLSFQDKFEVSLRIPTGKKIPDPTNPELTTDVYRGWTSKTYHRQSPTPQQYLIIDKLKARFHNETDPYKVADDFGRLYQWIAYFYLEMPFEEFVRCNWEELKTILDACSFKTSYQVQNK